MIIEVRIGKNKYKLNCRPDESENILEFSDRLDSRVKELQENIEDVNEAHLLVIAGLMLEQELQDKTDQMSGELKQQLYSEDDLFEALSEQMENITNYVKKITAKIENS
jgi:cell division protein ZapA